MIIRIAHRALLQGPSIELENHPDSIMKALGLGFHAEIDVRYIDGEWWLGHDKATYPTTLEFLSRDGLWLHAKNLAALEQLTATSLNYFAHDRDPYVITSHGYIWTYPGQPLGPRSICVMPEWNMDTDADMIYTAAGICTDWPYRYHRNET